MKSNIIQLSNLLHDNQFYETILSWFKQNQRNLYWRENRKIYLTYLTEVMLQQTTVSTVQNKLPTILKEFPDFKSFKLEQNYRSTKSIVETANHLISFNKKQLRKKVWTNNSIGSSVVIHKCNSDNEEAKLVANTIFDLKIRDDICQLKKICIWLNLEN